MTAINPARLKIQCAQLSQRISDPEIFARELHDLLTFYAARVRQTDLSKTPLSLQSYQVPAPVLRRLSREMEEVLIDHPPAGFALVDRLWQEDWVEFRQLAIRTLGSLSTIDPDAILLRISAWLASCTAEEIRREIMDVGLGRLAADQPQAVHDFLFSLIDRGTKEDQQAAIFGLSSLAGNPDFEDIPVLFNLLEEILISEESGLVKEISALVKEIRMRSEQETTYFLIRLLPSAQKPRISRVIRGTINEFNPENRGLLKAAIGKYS